LYLLCLLYSTLDKKSAVDATENTHATLAPPETPVQSVPLCGIFKVRVESATKAGLRVSILVDKKTVGPPALLPLCHLTDNLENWDLLGMTYQTGDVIDHCVLFSLGNPMVVSAKPSLVKVRRFHYGSI